MRFSKYILVLFLVLSLSLLINSCATTGTDRGSANVDQLLIENPELTLKDYLRRVSGIQVTEQGGRVRVVLRGATSLTGDNSPLFVVDGSQVGTSYEDLENSVDIRDVDFIQVMRSSEAMTTYGMRASNGAIVVHTKRN